MTRQAPGAPPPSHPAALVRSAITLARRFSPEIIRATQALGVLSSRSNLLVSLSEAELMSAACRETGLSDFGDLDFLPALRVLLGAFERDSKLNLVGRIGVRQELLRLLSMRLCIENDFKHHPELAEVPIRRPLFVVGLPRTGTTLLHKLLSADPNGRAPLLWELWYPASAPRWQSSRVDPRIARTALTLDLMSVMSPGFSAIHHLAYDEPDECFHVLEATFLCSMFGMRGDVHSYMRWLYTQDMRPAYRFHHRVLQRLQWGRESGHVVLKSPVHLSALDALFEIFPDACVVQTHRHPLSAAASCCSMTRATRVLHSDAVDSKRLGADWMNTWGTAMDLSLEARRRIDPARICDVSYGELMVEPQRVVRQIYDHFGYAHDERMAAGVDRWLRDNPQNKHGEHSYSADDFGLDPAEVRRRFAGYLERFSIPEARVRKAPPAAGGQAPA